MKIQSAFALATLGGAMILSSGTQAAYTGVSVELHTTVSGGGIVVPRSVYRVYANFTDPDDIVHSWFGTAALPAGPPPDPFSLFTLDSTGLAPGSNFFNPGGAVAGSTAPSLDQINGGIKTPSVPGIQWGTYATIGVNIADQGSGPGPGSPYFDQTQLSPGFPNFITSSLNALTSGGTVSAEPQALPNSQGAAGYTPDGDFALRVQLMQLTVNLGHHVAGEFDLEVLLAGAAPGGYTIFEDQTFNSFIPAPATLSLLGLALTATGMPSRRRRLVP